MVVMYSLDIRGGFIFTMTQFLDEAGLQLFWKKVKAKLPYDPNDPQTVAEKNTHLVEKDITSMYTDGSLFENVKNGSFDGINPGNYFNATVNNLDGVETNFTFVILELDRYYGKPDNTGTSKTHHHIVVTPKGTTTFGEDTMDGGAPKPTNNGGYIGSDMFKTTIPKVDSELLSTFGTHLKTVSLNLSNTGYNQKPYTYVNTLVTSYLFTEYEVLGNNVYDDENYTAYPQYAALKLKNSLLDGVAYWTRSMCGANGFCYIQTDHTSYHPVYKRGTPPEMYAVRPAFLLG